VSRVLSRSAAQTLALGRDFALNLRRGDVVALEGTLGSGKTQFVKGVVSRFAPAAKVTSPTFVVVHRYEGKDDAGKDVLLFHADLYRIRSADELTEAGFADIAGPDAILLIEWADKFRDVLPRSSTVVRFAHGATEQERIIDLDERAAA
jgi:tRNA threonylcarbamoyladenosine biosynthesis protein TsaE